MKLRCASGPIDPVVRGPEPTMRSDYKVLQAVTRAFTIRDSLTLTRSFLNDIRKMCSEGVR